MKKDNTSNSDVLNGIKSIADVVSMELNVDDLKNNLLGKVDNIIDIVQVNIDTKTKKIDNYEKVFDGLKLDLSIYQKQTKTMEYEIKKARKEAITDELTGLYTKRMLEHRLEEEYAKFVRSNDKYSILFLCIKNMANILESSGDYVIEYVIIHVTKLIKHCIRKVDIPFRYSENEFLLLLPQTDIEKMQIVANRINNTMKNTAFTYREEKINVFTALGGTEIIADKPVMDTVEKARTNLLTAIESSNYTVILD